MPHDSKGQKLEVGDRVRIPVRPVRTLQIQTNPEYPNEYPPQLWVADGLEEQVEGVVAALYEHEDACNAQFEVVGMPGSAAFNTRLVEKITGDES